MSNFKLHIFFESVYGSHSGHCSDSGNRKYDKQKSDEIVDIPENLPPEAVDDNGNINNLDCLEFLEYRKPHGNGRCGVYSTRRVIRAKIVDITQTIKAKWMRALEPDESDEEVD